MVDRFVEIVAHHCHSREDTVVPTENLIPGDGRVVLW